MEIRPSIKWNKGNAVEYFLDTLGLSSCNDILPVYIGDDKTDEDAFKVCLTLPLSFFFFFCNTRIIRCITRNI